MVLWVLIYVIILKNRDIKFGPVCVWEQVRQM